MSDRNRQFSKPTRRVGRCPRAHNWSEYGLARARERQIPLAAHYKLEARLRQGKWQDDFGSSDLMQRTTVCKLMDGRILAGFIEFKEYDFAGHGHETFLSAMDEISQSAHDCSHMITAAIAEEDHFIEVFLGGPLVEVATAWRHPGYPEAAVWSEVANAILSSQLAGYSVAALKAFPLEYEHLKRAPQGTPASELELNSPKFHTRVAAMMRMYSRRLGFHPAPQPYSSEGWMIKYGIDVDPASDRQDRTKSQRWTERRPD